MTKFLLIRHAHTDAVGRYIAGRRPGVGLTAVGHAQQPVLVAALAREPVTHLYSSPLERTRQTAEPLGRAWGVPVEIADELIEIDFGEWTGKTFAELGPDPLWRLYNRFRSGTRVPGGEVMSEVQDRAVGFVQRLRDRLAGQDSEHAGQTAAPEQTIALVTHGDIVRAILAYYMGLAMDLFIRVDIDPASVTALRCDAGEPQILYVNRVG